MCQHNLPCSIVYAHCLLPGRAFASLYVLLFLEKEAEIGGRDCALIENKKINYSRCSKTSNTGSYHHMGKILITSCLQKGIDKQCRPRSDCFFRSSPIRVFPVCSSDKHFKNSSLVNNHFIGEPKENSVPNFRNFTIVKSDVFNLLETVILLTAQYGTESCGSSK